MAKNKSSTDTKTLQIMTHILGLLTYFIGPLIVMLVAQDKTTKNHARAALNWQITATIYFIVSFILMIILIGIVLVFVVSIINIIFCIIAAVKASEGELYNYPLTIQFFKIE